LGKRFDDQANAAEELIAEIASAFLCAELGIMQDPRADHATIISRTNLGKLS
jgi:antirestriction protein ArdC